MFTGLVQEKSQIVALKKNPSGIQVKIEFHNENFFGLGEGDSVMIDGVCLTARDVELDFEFSVSAWFDVSHETLRCTHFSGLSESSWVHAETSLKAGDPIGGHFVTGHVEGVGEITRLQKRDRFLDAELTLKDSFKDSVRLYLIPKGSIAIDGVSLTINSMDETQTALKIGLTLIPETLQKTKWSEYQVGDKVNVESDSLVKAVVMAVKRLVPEIQAQNSQDRKAQVDV